MRMRMHMLSLIGSRTHTSAYVQVGLGPTSIKSYILISSFLSSPETCFTLGLRYQTRTVFVVQIE